MMWRLALCVAISGCWPDEPLVDGTFTREEWSYLQTMQLPAPELCPGTESGIELDKCGDAALFGQVLFFEQALSGKINIDDPFAPGALGEVGKVSCANCHDSSKLDSKDMSPNPKRRFFTDTRSQPSNISSGANYTKHNAMSVVNVAFKSVVAAQNCAAADASPFCANAFAWTGAYPTPGGVFNLAGPKAMNSDGKIVGKVIRDDPKYSAMYINLFHILPCDAVSGTDDCAKQTFTNIGFVFEAYLRHLTSVNSPFDRYIAGTVGADHTSSARDAISDEARHGLELFIGKAMCVECHRGPLLSDLRFHNIGVAQVGPHVPSVDGGLGTEVQLAMPADHLGEFLTPPLRNVADTAPYQHAGQRASLADVIDFYRRGGDSEGFSGRKDPRIQPLEIDDDEARELEAFLRTLTGDPIPTALAEKPVL
jgi:cytochrome c peroxidase